MKYNQWIKQLMFLLLFLTTLCDKQVQIATQSNSVSIVTHTYSEIPRVATSTSSPTSPPQSPTFTLAPTGRLSTATTPPTLTADEAKALVFDLLRNNGDCAFPCLWGLTPGQTDIATLNEFLARFGDLVSPNVYVNNSIFEKSGLLALIYRENNVHIVMNFFFFNNIEKNNMDLLGLYGYSMLERGKDFDWLSPDISPLYGDYSFNQAFKYYSLQQILSNYGPPTQVLLAPFPDDPIRTDITWHPFSLVLYYPDRGIFLEYVSPRETVDSDYVGCPSKAHIKLAVWSPESHLPLKYITQKAGSEINELNMDYFKSVEEATSLSLEEFYQKFKDPENRDCLETPIKLWSLP